ncbi:DUF6415 family natural product biosynthesis protein [Streptomyces brasiliensis]|uniref:Uncharacterized protein n=1 Tax=Streptomyces brasiliensis TaxID=1954 RepID=A0A917P2K8_9ACTN|nr:DUF6415 family natural product biosynthesis protein [Streptomyces brasiliensis]GGJ56563.1 hypothetical protein GCM10010121_079030 [Streptomyces brasiliensis]
MSNTLDSNRQLDTAGMRAAASRFLGDVSVALPRYEYVQRDAQQFFRFLWQLIPQIEQLTGRTAATDAPAMAALAGVGEARRRLDLIERPGLRGEVERVTRLARSVMALCDHYDILCGVVMCLACDKPIQDGDESVPYDQISPSGRAKQAGRIHASCANTIRRR